MREVKIDRSRLAKTVTANRQKHVEEYELALDGYKQQLANRLKDLTKQVRTAIADQILEVQVNTFDLPQPENHVSDYDTVLEMIDFSVDTEFVLTQQEFKQYVLDEWHWTAQLVSSNKFYAASMT